MCRVRLSHEQETETWSVQLPSPPQGGECCALLVAFLCCGLHSPVLAATWQPPPSLSAPPLAAAPPPSLSSTPPSRSPVAHIPAAPAPASPSTARRPREPWKIGRLLRSAVTSGNESNTTRGELRLAGERESSRVSRY